MFRMCVHIKWFWKFCNTLDINFLRQVLILWKSSGKAKASQEKLLHVIGKKKRKKKGTTFWLIFILLNTAEDLLCIYRTVSKALYCCSVYCIFITFKKYTTMSRACFSFYWPQHQKAIHFSQVLRLAEECGREKGANYAHSSLYQEYFMRCNLPTSHNTICSSLMLASGGRQCPLILSSHLLEHSTLTWQPVYEGVFKLNGWKSMVMWHFPLPPASLKFCELWRKCQLRSC